MALAQIVLNLVDAFGAVCTRIRNALVDVQFTVLSLVAGSTAIASESAQLIDAVSSVQAGISHTVVYVDVANATRHSRDAGAGEVVDHVDAGGSIRAGIAFAFIDIDFAVLPLVARLANTFVGVDLDEDDGENIIIYYTKILARMQKQLNK